MNPVDPSHKDPTKKDPDAIEAEIAETRNAISERLNAIGDKLSPEHIKEEARDLMEEAKEAAVEKLREVKENALESVNETMHEVGDRARRAGVATYDYARTNAIPLGLIGLGVGLLLMSSSRRRRHERDWEPETLGGHRLDYDHDEETGLRERGTAKLRRAVAHTEERARDLSQRAQRGIQRGARRARHEFERAEGAAADLARENPLAVGAGALVAGVAVGLLLPSTRREDELLGKTRDQLVDEVRGSVEGASRAAKNTARDVQNALR
jgi:hypothetical protein